MNGNSGSSDCYAAYRVAGEMFGRLKTALGFGDLVMYEKDRTIIFQWEFSAKQKRYCSSFSIDFLEIAVRKEWAGYPEEIAERWKNEHRRVTA